MKGNKFKTEEIVPLLSVIVNVVLVLSLFKLKSSIYYGLYCGIAAIITLLIHKLFIKHRVYIQIIVLLILIVVITGIYSFTK